jgi:hypothetical protein
MNRFVFGKGWVYQDEADDTGGAGGGAAAGGAAHGADDGAGAGAEGAEGGADAGAVSGDGGAPAKKEGEAPDMKSAIDAGLGYKPAAGDDLMKSAIDTALANTEHLATKAPGRETETHHANGLPKKNHKGEDLDDKGQVLKAQAPKPKSAAELALKPEELKALGAKTQQRFGEMINTLKAHEGTIAKQTEQIKGLSEARDAILGVMEETGTTQEQLANYLEFNALLQSTNPKDLEQALQLVENQRASLYKALGREPQGDFSDLAKQVDEEEITRAAALEIAAGRREKQARDEAARREQEKTRTTQQSAEQKKQAADAAFGEIEKWSLGLAKSDLDYKAKEDKLLGQLDEVLKEYPPNLWLTTLKRLYAGIEIQKAPAPSGKQNQPLRPSGAKPGAKAPSDMLEAINSGLGYGNG